MTPRSGFRKPEFQRALRRGGRVEKIYLCHAERRKHKAKKKLGLGEPQTSINFGTLKVSGNRLNPKCVTSSEKKKRLVFWCSDPATKIAVPQARKKR